MEPIVIKPKDPDQRDFLLELIRRLGLEVQSYPENLDEETLQALVEDAGVAGTRQKQVPSEVHDNTMHVNYPSRLPDAIHLSSVEFEREAKMAMAVKLFELKKISSGIAATIAGVDRVSFLLNLSRYGVDMINMEEEELLSDLENALCHSC